MGDASLIPFLDPVFEKLQEWTAEGLQYLGIGEENSYKLAAGAFLIVSLKGGGKSKPSTNMVKKGSQHGNSLSSTRPTWGYKLYENETNRFLKNGITSRKISETRYTKKNMKDKHMKHF